MDEERKKEFQMGRVRRGKKGNSGNMPLKSLFSLKVSVEYVLSNGKVFPANFPVHLRTKIDRDNSDFMEESRERLRSRKAERVATRSKQRRMIEQYKGLRWQGIHGGESGDQLMRYQKPYEFLPTQFLISWLADPLTCGPIETRGLLCQHGNLDIDKLTEVKVCSADMVAALYKQHGEGEGPRLTQNKLCWTCVMNKARLISLEYKMSRDQEFLSKCESPCDGTGFWVGKRSFQQWKRHAKVALEDQIIQETNQNTSPTPSKMGSRLKVEKAAEEEAFCLTELQAKLQKMGTNVSLALQDGSSKGNSNLTGLSVIKNGEAFKMNSLAEMKMNLSEEEKKGWLSKQESWNKPVQAVRPMQKAPKPSATVKPFIKSEGISDMTNVVKAEATEAEASSEEQRKLLVLSPSEDRSKVSEKSSVLPENPLSPKSPAMSSNGLNGHSEPEHHIKCNGNTSADHRDSSTLVRSPTSEDREKSLPAVKQEETLTTVKEQSNLKEEVVSPPRSDAALATSPTSSLTSTPSKPMAKVAPDPMVAAAHHEDPFNADIQCHHRNMRIEQRVRQLISRPAWHRVS